ncbi:hypothetical protein LNKW23_13430 [Paralimibaculum aggregatum]|uniref:Uncharacterized protein n=1 Tax=Paralimibaculum aggregatum TaxID=3036245 RepID=A0ABQ6LIS1_9RHOB|nr:hypothetical protein LNKW23_13430 [Limibaculum sp. NKW23]
MGTSPSAADTSGDPNEPPGANPAGSPTDAVPPAQGSIAAGPDILAGAANDGIIGNVGAVSPFLGRSGDIPEWHRDRPAGSRSGANGGTLPAMRIGGHPRDRTRCRNGKMC